GRARHFAEVDRDIESGVGRACRNTQLAIAWQALSCRGNVSPTRSNERHQIAEPLLSFTYDPGRDERIRLRGSFEQRGGRSSSWAVNRLSSNARQQLNLPSAHESERCSR